MKINTSLKFAFFISLVLFQASNQNFLQFDTKKNCPNVPMTPLGMLISLAETEEDSAYESYLSYEDRVKYEEILSLKRSFASTMSYIPRTFAPEKEEYWDALTFLVVIFVIIAIFPTIFIVFYLFMRFILRKCTGPKKLSEVNKMYRNITWTLMIISSLVAVILFSIVLGKSVATGNNIETTFNYANEIISGSDNSYPKIEEAVNEFKSKKLPVPSDEFMATFKENIELYIKNTKERTQQILDDDSKRTVITIVIFVIYILLVGLAYLFFFLKIEIMECIVSILLFFALPGLIVLEGYNAKFFFYYTDMCDAVHGALYHGEFPVAGQALGYYYNCFPLETKSALYNIRYRLYEDVYTENNNTDSEVNKTELEETYKKLHNETLDRLFDCEIVSSVIPKIEGDFCKESLDHMYSLVELMTWIVLFSLGVAIGSRRLQVLIWKRKMEIESMLKNQEVLY